MNQIEALRIFCAAAETTNFKLAATRLGISPQAVTRGVGQLEAHFGELLFHRSTRGARLTQFGESLAQRALTAVTGVDDVFMSREVDFPNGFAGVVRIAAPSALGRNFVVQGLAPVVAAHPQLSIDLRVSDVLADVVDGQIDIGVRIGPLRDSRFVVRPVSDASLVIVGAPELVARIGRPQSKEDLMKAPLTVLIDKNTGRPWPWMFADGHQTVPGVPRFVTDDPESECAAVLAGLGYGQLPVHLALPHLNAGRLLSLVGHLNPAPSTIYVYRPHRTPVPARIRLVFDALCSILASSETVALAARSGPG